MSAQPAADLEKVAKGLVGEIFELTGQKVEPHDPIVVAALIHSQLIRRAGQDAISGIQSAVAQSLADLAEAVKAERQAAADIGKATAEAHSQIIAAARAASEAEVPKMHAQFINIAQDVLLQVRKEAGAAAPQAWKIKVSLGIAALVLLGAAAGAIIGSTWWGKAAPAKLTDEQSKQIEAGRDFLQVFPQLDQGTKDKLVRMIEKNRGQ